MTKEDLLYTDVETATNIGFDVHGVLDSFPLQPLLKELVDKGFVIHILSGPSKQQVESELLELGYIPEVHFHYLFSVVDYLKAEKVKMWQDEKKRWWAEEENWWKSKGTYCKMMHCEYLFDNSIKYKKYMPPPTNFICIINEESVANMMDLLKSFLIE